MNERRTGQERREMPPTCSAPCPPLLAQYEKLKKCIDEKVKDKVQRSTFQWVVGGLAAFCVIIIGGAQWMIVKDNRETSEKFLEKMAEVTTMQAVTAERTRSIGDNLERHLRNSEIRLERIDSEMKRLQNENYKQHGGAK